ncbi:unnamed protein product [Toxocara canis]|uniref:DUF3752 domain-containing protein n=1 Tax=Toxocara canis TaxID=6265 RepID=A0A3P7GFX8_TOXCA|nr:unnamed protein product [Toxocara canis]
MRIARSAKNDATQERLAIQLNKERGVSLLDVHQRKRKLAAHQNESSGESGGRRPFDRERDMQVQGMRGEIGVAELKERCGQLSSRFGHSSSQKFL